MPLLEYDPQAEAELDALWNVDVGAAALIEELLAQFEESAGLLDELCKVRSNPHRSPSFEVKRFQHLWRKQYTIYILKVWATDGALVQYRIIYAHHPQKDVYYVLALMDRELNYEADRDLISRICTAYERLGIPRY